MTQLKHFRTSLWLGSSAFNASIRQFGLGNNGGANWPFGHIYFDDNNFRIGFYSTENILSYGDIIRIRPTALGDYCVEMKEDASSFMFTYIHTRNILNEFKNHGVEIVGSGNIGKKYILRWLIISLLPVSIPACIILIAILR